MGPYGALRIAAPALACAAGLAAELARTAWTALTRTAATTFTAIATGAAITAMRGGTALALRPVTALALADGTTVTGWRRPTLTLRGRTALAFGAGGGHHAELAGFTLLGGKRVEHRTTLFARGPFLADVL
ncbi:MAG: hypothetical protein RL339_158, partial [Pseudomonadota bacterium]